MTALSHTIPVQFAQLAGLLATRMAEIINGLVLIADERGIVIAGSDTDLLRLPADQVANTGHGSFLRMPLHLEGQAGEVLVSQPSDGGVLSPRLAQNVLDLVINQTTVVERMPNQHELKNDFIYDLLHAKMHDTEAIARHARFLGLDFAPPRAVILIDAADYILGAVDGSRVDGDDPRGQRMAQFVIGSVVSFFHLPNDTICGYLGNGEVAVLKASNTRNLAGWTNSDEFGDEVNTSWANLAALKRAGDALLKRLRADTNTSVSIGIGRYHPGLAGLAQSYQDAMAALLLGRRFHGQNRVHCLDGLGIAAFVGVSDHQTKLDLAHHLLSPLDHEPEMLATLEAYFAENCSPSATAQRLSVHRNTLSYRLEKITSLTGLDPRHFDEAVQIRLALVLRTLEGSEE